MIKNTNNKKDIFIEVSNHLKEYILVDELTHTIVNDRTNDFLDDIYDKNIVNRKDLDDLGRYVRAIVEIIKSAP